MCSLGHCPSDQPLPCVRSPTPVGEDLGPAYYNFPVNDLFPALSLNVRQCVRVNFGQSAFIYPPDEVDGIPFNPITKALQKQKTPSNLSTSMSNSVPSPAVPVEKEGVVAILAAPVLRNAAASSGSIGVGSGSGLRAVVANSSQYSSASRRGSANPVPGGSARGARIRSSRAQENMNANSTDELAVRNGP